MAKKIPSPEEIQESISLHDYEERIKKETEFLRLAMERGELEHQMAATLIEYGKTMRMVANILPTLQPKTDCMLAHSGKTGRLALLGTTWKGPISAFIFCGLIWLLVNHYDPLIHEKINGINPSAIYESRGNIAVRVDK